MDRQKEFVLRTLEERDIRFVRLWFTDVLGTLKSVAIAPAELDGAFEEGIGFDGSSIEGFARVSESDTIAHPDPSTFQVLPWTTAAGHHHSARMFCDITMPDGSPSWADPRHVLRRQLSKASDLGFSCYVHPEIEFFLLEPGPEDGSTPIPADNAGYFDQAVHTASNFRRHAIDALEFMGISVEFSHHEGAPGQQEIDLRFADALSMADNVMTFRYVIKEVALEERMRATFMPKPFGQYPGSAMHTHMSLFEGEVNAFHSPDDALQLSDVAKSFIAGISSMQARSARLPTNGSTPTSGWFWAVRHLPPRRGGRPTGRHWCVFRCTAQAKPPRDVSRSVARTRPATPTSRSPCCWPPGCAGSRRVTSWARKQRTTSGTSPPKSAGRWATASYRRVSTKRFVQWRVLSSSQKRWGERF